ncbi:MAG: RagB/SusD family nutrient uptake outer membrane protein, partial [Ekhidna sp.]
MKAYNYLFLLIGLTIVGCSDLEEDPITELSPDSYFSALSLTEVKGFVAGSYAHMVHRNFMSREMTQALMFRSDMMAIGRTGAQERIDHDNFTVQADNGLIAGGSNVYWPKVYQIIGAANEAIKSGLSLTDVDEAERNEVIAEARFARAFAYFHLVRQFGAIPYLDDTTLLSEAAVAERTPAETVYENIIADFEYAKANLPNTQPSRAIPAKSAASAYLALVYLTLEEWQKSYDEAKEIINNEGTYNLGLEPNFQDLYDAVKIDESLEPIFVLDFTGVSDGDQGRDYQVAFTGIRSDDQYDMGGGWSVEVPALKVFTTWDDQDYRKVVTFDATAVQDGEVVPYTNFTDADGRAVNRPHVAKYTRMASKLPQQDGNGRSSHSNYMMMRYAEVLMIGAEAANEIGQTADAETWVNRVMARSRAGGVSWANGAEVTIPPSTVPADFSGLSQSDFRTRILEERRLEFAYEMKR